ncbi:MAG: SseB family protein [Thiotrichales bacterium]
MTNDLHPTNALEHAILRFHRGEIDAESFAHSLPPMQVFVPVNDEKSAVDGSPLGIRAEPLVVADEYGAQVLILFTSPDRSKGFLRNFPGFQGGMITELEWMLRRMGEDVGIAINPGHDLGFDLDPKMIQALLTMLPSEFSK